MNLLYERSKVLHDDTQRTGLFPTHDDDDDDGQQMAEHWHQLHPPTKTYPSEVTTPLRNGIVPLRPPVRCNDAPKYCRFDIVNHSSGMEPSKELPCNDITVRADSVDSDTGRVPSNEFRPRSKYLP